MTATDILNRWDPISSLFVKAGSWLGLLRIAAAGPHGLLRSEIRAFGTGNIVRTTLNQWLEAEIITVQHEPNTNHKGNNPRHTYYRQRFFITEKGLRLLRLDPEA